MRDSALRSPFHAGEIAAQERAGTRAMAAKVGGSIHTAFPPPAAAFLAGQPMVVLASTDDAGRPWASILTGAPGFAAVTGPRTARVAADPVGGDPLAANLGSTSHVGLLVPDLATRRRLRVNGRLGLETDGAFLIHADQVYANCPKYIQRRSAAVMRADPPERRSRTAASLTEAQRAWIRGADTFFIASANPGEGADASHRGGTPGFVTVEGDRLSWPDYAGNMMFNTIGNLLSHPWAGLAFPDFPTGAVLLLSGRVSIGWTPTASELAAGAERMLHLEVERVVELEGAIPFSTRLEEPSPFNPGVWKDAGPASPA